MTLRLRTWRTHVRLVAMDCGNVRLIERDVFEKSAV